MNKDKKSIVKILCSCAKDYEFVYLNKNYLFLYASGGSLAYKQVAFRDYNYLHLTGVETSLKASVFFEACISARLSERDFEIRPGGSTFQKLSVLPGLRNLVFQSLFIGDFNHNGFRLNSDYLAGDTKEVMSLGFKSFSAVDYPNTLLKMSIKEVTTEANKVVAIFSKAIDAALYDSITFKARNVDFETLKIPIHILSKIDPILLAPVPVQQIENIQASAAAVFPGEDPIVVLGEKIEAGSATPEEVTRFNEIQEQRLRLTVETAKLESHNVSLDDPEKDIT